MENDQVQLNEFSKQICFMTGFRDKENSKSFVRYQQQFLPQPWTDQPEPILKANFTSFYKTHHNKPKNIKKPLNFSLKNYGKSKISKTNTSFKTLSPQFWETTLYSFNTEQKQKISLEKIAHEKHNKRFSRLLKMRNSMYEQQKIGENQNQDDKNSIQHQVLIHQLQKFDSDLVLKKSIDRAIQVLRKRTNYNVRKLKNYNQMRLSSQQLVKSIDINGAQQRKNLKNKKISMNQTSYQNHRKNKSFSSVLVSEQKPQKINPSSQAKNKNVVSNISLQIQLKKQPNPIKGSMNNKIIFKPRRNWITAKKTVQNDIILHKDSSIKINSLNKQKLTFKNHVWQQLQVKKKN